MSTYMDNYNLILEPCTCKTEYCIEPHGNGYALYLGRCIHKHGYNIAYITEPDMPKLEAMLKTLNNASEDNNAKVCI
jgi:hypothetical protein